MSGVRPEATGGGSTRVGYVLKMFPRLSETFILNELLELERQGADVSVFSLNLPNDGKFHGRLGELKLTAEYFLSDKSGRYWSSGNPLNEDSFMPDAGRWQDATDFLRRHSIDKGFDLLMRAVQIADRARKLGVGHLHAHFATVATHAAALAGILSGIPFSFTAHAKDIFRHTVNRDLFAELVDRAAFVVTVSDFNREFLLSQEPRPDAKKIHRLYNGIDLSFFEPAPARPVGPTPHIVSVGRMVPKKGFDHLLRALGVCRYRGLDFKATLIGEGEELGALRQLSRSLGLEDRITFAGSLPIEQVRSTCSTATLMALACVADADGNMDALPTVLLEALALDVPIVSTRLTGIPEIVGDEAGELVQPGDDPGLAEAIERVCQAVRQGDLPCGKPRQRAERLFDLRKNVGELHRRFAKSAAEAAA